MTLPELGWVFYTWQLNSQPDYHYFHNIQCKTTLSEHQNTLETLLSFLNSIGVFKPGDQVCTMKGKWVVSKQNTKRWQRTDFEVILDGSGTNHYVEYISETQLIYMRSFSVGLSGHSETSIYKSTEQGWVKEKSLQKLIR